MKIVWTKHAEDRQKEWEKKLGITKQEVENALNIPGQTVPGDMGVPVARKKTRNGLLRIPFREIDENLKILTLYWTSKVEKYWKEE